MASTKLMETKNERLREVRKACCMTMDEMGAVIGISKSGISEVESGRRNLTEKHIKMLSSSVLKNGKKVNAMWLRTGEGEMFDSQTNGISEILEKIGADKRLANIARIFFAMPYDAQECFGKFAEAYIKKVEEQYHEEMRKKFTME